MYNGYKIKPFVFAGRKQNMEILFPLLNDTIIDEVIIGLNTNDPVDTQFIHEYVNTHTKFSIVDVPHAIKRTPSAYRYMFSKMQDADTIYIKIDDDILRFSNNFWEDLIKFRVSNPNYLLVYPFVINNPFCNYISGWFKNKFNNPSDCMYWSWSNPLSAAFLLTAYANNKLPLDHLSTMNRIETNHQQAYYRREISDYVRPSINVICFFGKDCYEMNWIDNMKASRSDEVFLTHDIFTRKLTNRMNCIIPNIHCVHYSFYPQKNTLNQLGIFRLYQRPIS